MHVSIGSRVWYKEGGDKSDTGTIIDIVLDDNGPFIVKWDRQRASEFIAMQWPPQAIANALGIQSKTIYTNLADENIDGYKGSQLELIDCTM